MRKQEKNKVIQQVNDMKGEHKKTTEKLKRIVFEQSRELEFFSEKELEMQIGHGIEWWPIAILREIIDNALDGCENSNISPEIWIETDDKSFTVTDNGVGLSSQIIKKSQNYLKRVSDKTYYVSPTRGQMGNALKVIWAEDLQGLEPYTCLLYDRAEGEARGEAP